MKKMKKFQDGGTADENFTPEQLKFLGGADRTDPYILARMRKAAPDAPKAAKVDTKVDSGELRDETGEKSKIRRNTETGDLYDTESSFKPMIKNSPVTEAKKPVTVKTKEVVVEKTKEEPKKPAVSEKQKAAAAEPSFFRGTKGYNLSDVTGKIKSMLPEGSDRRTEKQKAAGEEPSFLRGTKGYNLPDFKMPEGSDRRTEKQKAAGEEPSFLRGTKGYNLSDFTKSKSGKDPAYKDAGYKKGGKVSSASRRGDGIAIRGKTRA
jgi:hypothetical protein